MRTFLIVAGVLAGLTCAGFVVVGLMMLKPDTSSVIEKTLTEETQLKRIAEAPLGESITRNGVTVHLSGAWIETPPLVNAAGEAVPNVSGVQLLVFRGSIKGYHHPQKYSNFATSPATVLATADALKRIPAATLPAGAELADNKHDVTLYPMGEEYPIALAFEVPPGGEDLVLDLDGAAIGWNGEGYRFLIPRDALQE